MSMFRQLSPEMIRRVCEANCIEELVGAGVTLKRSGAALVGLCPFHREKTPSFTITTARQRFRCYGCGVGGDVIAYEMALHGIGFTAAVHRLAERRGIHLEGFAGSAAYPVGPRPLSKASAKAAPPKVLRLPRDLRALTHAEMQIVASQRGLSAAGIELAVARGLLWYGSPKGRPSWVIKDAERTNAQARRMDGQRWPHIGDKKAYTLPGARASWPVGTREADGLPCVVLTEGSPDFLAAHHFLVAEGREDDTAAVAMLGAWNSIPEDALLFLSNKRVRLFPHLDTAGREAAVRWTRQLERVGCTVDAFDFRGLTRADGEPVKDLNDLALIDADCFEAERANLVEVLPR